MDAIEELQQDLEDGRIDGERLLALIGMLQRSLQSSQQQLEATQQQLEAAQQRIQELEKKLGNAGKGKLNEPFSMKAEEKRQEKRRRKKKRKLSRRGRRGRLTNADKLQFAERIEPVYPEGVPQEDCHLSHTRPVWRLENGRAVLIGYAIYRGPHNQYGQIPGVLGRSEFGLEIVLEMAYFVYALGISFDKVCQLLNFLQHLHLNRAQVDSLLRQLARHWEQEFEVLCTLLANSLVVHTDETSWSIKSVWAFLSEKARLLLFGVPKSGQTLKKLLDPETFRGLVISDDAAVYAHFSQAQKCWAHLLRKAIKLTLQDPKNLAYRGFTDDLLDIYDKACQTQRDGRLSPEGRAKKVVALDDAIFDLCAPMWGADLPPLKGLDNDYRLLVNEVMRLMLAQQLFTFVTAPPLTQLNGETKPVANTNNEAERTLRNPAQARQAGRTNKSPLGARRQTVIVSVLESLRLYLKTYTLSSIIAEIQSWLQTGQSCFRRLLKKLNLPEPEEGSSPDFPSILDKILPIPDG